MNLPVFRKGFNYSQDGPGNRLVYHIKGCNLRCPWCSNPEGIFTDRGSFESVSTEAIVAEALSCRSMFFDGGGVTFTGGEATLHHEALAEALTALRSEGIHTAIETNGTSPRLAALLPLLDYLIIDLKHPDSEKHKAVTGFPNEQIKKNITHAANYGMELLVRIPLIGGFNTDQNALHGFAAFFRTLAIDSVGIELLKYHEYGKTKWEQLGLLYQMTNAQVGESTRRHFEETFTQMGLKILRT